MNAVSLTLEHSVTDWVARYPELLEFFSSLGMNPTQNRALVFESLYASCIVQQQDPYQLLQQLYQLIGVPPS